MRSCDIGRNRHEDPRSGQRDDPHSGQRDDPHSGHHDDRLDGHRDDRDRCGGSGGSSTTTGIATVGSCSTGTTTTAGTETGRRHIDDDGQQLDDGRQHWEIGRASCRERVF